MTGATEATLAELLREAQNTNVNLARLNSLLSSSGSGGGGGGGSPLAGIVRAGPIASLALGALSAATNIVAGTFRIIGNILGKVVGGFTDTVKNLYEFSVSAAMGTAKLSDFYAAFKDLPFFIGTVASIFSQIIKYSEDLLVVYQNLTKVGASFGGELFVMRNAAARAQLSMADFASVVTKNSELFASMGGNVQTGINQFVNIQNRLMGPNSPYARQLLALGYTSADAAEMIASYMRGQGTMNKAELANVDKVSKSVVTYVQELDTLSKLTGKQREKMEEELKAVELEETYQRFLSQLDPKEAERIKVAVANMLQTGGKDAAEQLKLAVRGINTPITKGQMDLAASTQGLNLAVNDIIVQAIKQGKSQEEIGKIVREQSMRIGKQQYEFAEQLGESTVAALLASGNNVVTAGNNFSAFYRKLLADNKLPEAERKIIEQRLKQAEGDAAALSAAQNNLRNFGNSLLMAVSRFIAPLSGGLVKFGESITATISRLVASDGFKSTIESVTNWFNNAISEFEDVKSVKDFFTVLIDRAIDAYKNVVKALTPVWESTIKPALIEGWKSFLEFAKPLFSSFVEFLKPLFKEAFQALVDVVNDWIVEKTGFGELSKDRKQREMVQQGENYNRWLRHMQEQGNFFQRRLLEKGDPKEIYNMYKAQIEGGKWKPGTLGSQDPEYAKRVGGGRGSGAGMPLATPDTTPEPATPAPKRHSGTFGMTGFGTERSNQLVEVQPSEAVLTKEQMDQFGRSLAMGVEINNNLTSEMKTLNKQTADMLKFIKETAEYTRRNLDAIKGLDGNLFAA